VAHGATPPYVATTSDATRTRAGSRVARDVCQTTYAPPSVKGHWELPGGGHEDGPVVATRSAQSWPLNRPWGLAQGDHPFAGYGLGEANALAAGLAEMSVM
jgi:hypothetical protein